MPVLYDVSAVRRFLGLANQVAKFVPNSAETISLCAICFEKKQSWQWGVEEERTFNDVKRLLVAPGGLRHFDPCVRMFVSADSSLFVLEAVL